MADDRLCPPAPGPAPWLFFTHGVAKSKQVQTFYTPSFHNKSYLKSIPELRGKRLLGSQFGWLILLDQQADADNHCITLWNPVTSKAIHLPPLIHDDDMPVCPCFLTSPPSDNDDDDSNTCFVFYCFSDLVFCCKCQPRTWDHSGPNWVSKRIDIEGESVFIILGKAISLNGVIYAVAASDQPNNRRRHFVCIKVVDDGSNSFTFRSLPISPPDQFFSDILNQCYSFMVESCGSIYIVQAGTRHYNGVHAVKVWELDLQQEIWVEVDCIGDRAFFLSRYGSTWCWACTTSESIGSVEGNCVYIFRCEFAVDAVVLYRLKGCTSTFLPCPKLLNPRRLWPVWVMPKHQRYESETLIQGCTCLPVHSIRLLTGPECKKGIKKHDEVSLSCKMLPQQDETKQNYLSKLPLHMIEFISKYMHLFDYWSFRCTSKIFQSTMPPPQWRTNNLLPLFMAFENNGGLCRLMDPCRDDSHYCILQLSESYFDIEFSKNGWLLVWDHKSLQFFNPFTRVKGEFPSLKGLRRYYKIAFSTNPTCSDCLTVGIAWHNSKTIINYIRSGDIHWKSCHFDNQDIVFFPGYGPPIYFAGAFYCLDDNGRLGVFELVEGDATWTVYDKPYMPAGKLHSSYLVECSGKLISVFIGNKGKYVRVFRFNFSKKKWVLVNTLGSHILFISPYSTFQWWQERPR